MWSKESNLVKIQLLLNILPQTRYTLPQFVFSKFSSGQCDRPEIINTMTDCICIMKREGIYSEMYDEPKGNPEEKAIGIF